MTTESVNELLTFQQNIETLYASDSKVHKKLFVLGNGNYKITSQKGQVIKTVMQPFVAIEIYNELGGHQL